MRFRMPFQMSIKPYLALTRPFTLIAPMIAMICGMLMSLLHRDEFHLFSENVTTIFFAAITMALAQMCGQVLNQAEDPVALDILNNKAYRPIPQGHISQKFARRIGLAIGTLALVAAFVIKLSLGIGIAIILFFAIFYSMEPIRGKRRKIINTFWLGISRGLLPLLIAWSVFNSPWEAVPLILGSVLFFWVSAFNITKDFSDMVGDRIFQVPTFPVVYGVKTTKLFMHWLNALAFIIVIVAILTGKLHPGFLITGIVFIIGVPIIQKLCLNSIKLKHIENNMGWMFFYLGLSLLYILFIIAMVIG